MSIKSDSWIKRKVLESEMINPFEPNQVRKNKDNNKLIS